MELKDFKIKRLIIKKLRKDESGYSLDELLILGKEKGYREDDIKDVINYLESKNKIFKTKDKYILLKKDYYWIAELLDLIEIIGYLIAFIFKGLMMIARLFA